MGFDGKNGVMYVEVIEPVLIFIFYCIMHIIWRYLLYHKKVHEIKNLECHVATYARANRNNERVSEVGHMPITSFLGVSPGCLSCYNSYCSRFKFTFTVVFQKKMWICAGCLFIVQWDNGAWCFRYP